MNSYPGLVWSAEFDGAAVRLTRRRKGMTEEEIVALTDSLNAMELNRQNTDPTIEFVAPVHIAGVDRIKRS
jgi:hypothetical protein